MNAPGSASNDGLFAFQAVTSLGAWHDQGPVESTHGRDTADGLKESFLLSKKGSIRQVPDTLSRPIELTKLSPPRSDSRYFGVVKIPSLKEGLLVKTALLFFSLKFPIRDKYTEYYCITS